MRTRLAAFGIALLFALYIVIVAQYAIAFLVGGSPIGIAMGAALIVFPLLALWALYRELRFGMGAERLMRLLDAEGGLPEEEVELTPSGRPVKAEAALLLPAYEAAAADAPDDWRSHLRLSIVLDAAGRRADARARVRRAIELERADR